MTDPNVIEAVRKLATGVSLLASACGADAGRKAAELADEADAMLAAEKPAATATSALPWVVRRVSDGAVVAAFQDGTSAEYYRQLMRPRSDAWEVAPAAPAIVPVPFDSVGNAGKVSDGWFAYVPNRETVNVTVCLRPGEDAGDLTARIVAAVGRGP